MNIKGNRKIFLALYCIMFFAVWTIFELYFKDSVEEISSYLSLGVKFMVWTLPVILIVEYKFKENVLSYLKMKGNIKAVLKAGLIFGLVVAGYNMFNIIFLQKDINPSFEMETMINVVLLIGFTEEVVFRGFILMELQKMTKFWAANLISSLLFLLIHFPKWYKDGSLLGAYSIGSFAFVICFGLFQGYILKRTKSIWPCMITHSVNNFMTTFFII